MKGPAYRTIMACVAWATVSAGVGALALLPSLAGERPPGQLAWSVVALTWLAAIVLLGRAWHAAYQLGFGYERLRGAVVHLLVDRNSPMPLADGLGSPLELRALHDAIARYRGQVVGERRGPDQRLAAVVASLVSGVVVITEQGQVSLVNGAGRVLLGAERVRVGTSVFAALERHAVLEAVERSRAERGPVEATFRRLDDVALQARLNALPDEDGAILLFPPVELQRHRPEVDFDLELHDLPPPARDLELDLPLEELPTVVVDVETTGLDAASDRVVALGAIRVHGTRLYPGSVRDRLVAPGVPIPRSSSAVHGITDAMVEGAERFPAVYDDWVRLAAGNVVIGHNIPFDLTVMRHEAERYLCDWEPPPFLDTFRLAVILRPELGSHELENVARAYDVDVHGRHTALGDALVTAEIWVRMLADLRDRGLRTLGDVLRMHEREAPDVARRQRESGWDCDPPERFRAPRSRVHLRRDDPLP